MKPLPLHNIPILLITLATFTTLSRARDTITPTQPLADTDTLISSGGDFALGFFTPAGTNNRYLGLWYHKIRQQTVVWVANRDEPIVGSTGILSITPRGVLTVADSNTSAVVWSANAATGLTSPVAQLLDTGNFVVKQAGGGTSSYAWQGFDHPTDSMLPGMKVGVDKRTGLNSTVTSWKGKNDPSLGSVYAAMDPRGNPEIYIYSGSKKIWRTGAWNGVRLSGSPDSATYNQGFSFSFVSNSEEVTYSYVISNRSIVSRLVVTEEGLVQRRVWLWESSQWSVYWYAPKDPCDSYGMCGPYGACDPNNSPLCECLVSEPAFVPKNPGNWALRDGTQGCIRRTGLDCRNGTDGFVTVRNLKLPESENSVVDEGLDLDGCREKCLRNCSCTAYAAANISGGGSGSGCVVWFGELVDIRSYVDLGQDLYVRVAAADIVPTPEQSHKSKRATVAVVVSLLLGTLLLACVGCFMWRRKKKRGVMLGATTSFNDKSNVGARENDLDLPLFDFGTILASTNQFSEENKLGEGGFGPVYKGTLENGQELGVKRLSRTSTQGLEEFKNEVMLIAKLQHRNLVRLLGCCIQGEERMLIYEYMPNKSLDFFLFEKEKGALLDWQTRYQIILGIARGLLYLHQDSRFRIIHRDLKASNILLDKEMNPKISDFGMARIFGGDETDFNTRKVVGTYGYMSPEYAMDGVFSVKSDVFSFGVLVLEVVSGKKNRGVYSHAHHVNLLSHAWSLWREGKSMQLVDELIGYSYPMDEVLRCIKIGLLCVQERPEDRPLMSSVILMLSSDITSLPQPKQPGFAARRGPFETESSTSNQDSSGVNDITVTMMQGR